MPVYRRILLAVDLTDYSLQVGYRARALAAELDAELHLLHVVEPVPAVTPIPPEPVAPAVVTTQTEIIEIAEEQIAKLGREFGIPDGRRYVVMGNTKAEIVRVATDRGCDLIVLGARERHGLALFLSKPTEDVVLHRAPCDVLAVKLPEEGGKKK